MCDAVHVQRAWKRTKHCMCALDVRFCCFTCVSQLISTLKEMVEANDVARIESMQWDYGPLRECIRIVAFPAAKTGAAETKMRILAGKRVTTF